MPRTRFRPAATAVVMLLMRPVVLPSLIVCSGPRKECGGRLGGFLADSPF
jgi:hypothetical protein